LEIIPSLELEQFEEAMGLGFVTGPSQKMVEGHLLLSQ